MRRRPLPKEAILETKKSYQLETLKENPTIPLDKLRLIGKCLFFLRRVDVAVGKSYFLSHGLLPVVKKFLLFSEDIL